MKYIMFEKPLSENIVVKIPVIFPNTLVHEDVSKAILSTLGMETAKPVSAGFVNVLATKCYGESKTLELSANRMDFITILEYSYKHGLEEKL